jgi:hypothetical protein
MSTSGNGMVRYKRPGVCERVVRLYPIAISCFPRKLGFVILEPDLQSLFGRYELLL